MASLQISSKYCLLFFPDKSINIEGMGVFYCYIPLLGSEHEFFFFFLYIFLQGDLISLCEIKCGGHTSQKWSRIPRILTSGGRGRRIKNSRLGKHCAIEFITLAL